MNSVPNADGNPTRIAICIWKSSVINLCILSGSVSYMDKDKKVAVDD